MATEDEDLALDTLVAVMREIAPGLDEGLLRKCYALQKKYQFNDDRAVSTIAMERLIDAAVLQNSGEKK